MTDLSCFNTANETLRTAPTRDPRLRRVGFLTNSAVAADRNSVGVGPSFSGPIGLQLYSLRDQFAKDVPATLDQVRTFGIEFVELAGTYNLAPEKLSNCSIAGMKPVSGHFPFERYRDDVEALSATRRRWACSTSVAPGSRTTIHSTRKLSRSRRRIRSGRRGAGQTRPEVFLSYARL